MFMVFAGGAFGRQVACDHEGGASVMVVAVFKEEEETPDLAPCSLFHLMLFAM